MTIGKLTSVPLREVWQHEAVNFTAWLSENLEFLADTLNMQLSLVGREVAVGTFSADILCEDKYSNSVLIENQLERTDHDHLGKLITYMSNLGAKTAIWITSDPRPEHEQAVHWLNESLPADTAFYLVRIEAFRIGDSEPAPLFSIVAGPSIEARQIGGLKKEIAERHVRREKFWARLLEKALSKTSLHARISPSRENWISAGAGKSGLGFNYVVLMKSARIELYIDTGDTAQNKRIFDHLSNHRESIEEKFGGPIRWQRLDTKRASRISYPVEIGGLDDEGRWPETQEAMVDAMVRLHNALTPYISQL